MFYVTNILWCFFMHIYNLEMITLVILVTNEYEEIICTSWMPNCVYCISGNISHYTFPQMKIWGPNKNGIFNSFIKIYRHLDIQNSYAIDIDSYAIQLTLMKLIMYVPMFIYITLIVHISSLAGDCNLTMPVDSTPIYFVSPGYPDAYEKYVPCKRRQIYFVKL